MKLKRIIKRKYYYLISILLILFLFVIIFNYYSNKINPKIVEISKKYLKDNIYSEITSTIKNEIGKDDELNNILVINQNKNGEILYASFDIKKTYKLLNNVSNSISLSLHNKQNFNDSMIIKIPFGVYSSNPLISNLGPKITIKIFYINSIINNVYTKITNYGLNNALVEGYIKINIEGKIITPTNSINKNITYDLLISSQIISGRVPSFYGGSLTSNSNVLDIPIT